MSSLRGSEVGEEERESGGGRGKREKERKERRKGKERASHFQRLFQFSFPFNAISLMMSANEWLLFWKLPLGEPPLLASL